MIKENQAIGLIDSGIGGLTVLEELLKVLPNEKYIYVADEKYCPYANLENDILKIRVLKLCQFLESKKVKLIIIACNTASIYLKYIKKYIKTPIISVVYPTALKAIELTKNKKIGLLATSKTIESKIYNNILNKNDINVYNVKCNEFVKCLESESIDIFYQRKIVEEKIKEIYDKDIDTLIYGCTHFSLLDKIINDYIVDVKTISSDKITTIYVSIYLRILKLLNKKSFKKRIIIYSTSHINKIKSKMKLFKIKKYKLKKVSI